MLNKPFLAFDSFFSGGFCGIMVSRTGRHIRSIVRLSTNELLEVVPVHHYVSALNALLKFDLVKQLKFHIATTTGTFIFIFIEHIIPLGKPTFPQTSHKLVSFRAKVPQRLCLDAPSRCKENGKRIPLQSPCGVCRDRGSQWTFGMT